MAVSQVVEVVVVVVVVGKSRDDGCRSEEEKKGVVVVVVEFSIEYVICIITIQAWDERCDETRVEKDR